MNLLKAKHLWKLSLTLSFPRFLCLFFFLEGIEQQAFLLSLADLVLALTLVMQLPLFLLLPRLGCMRVLCIPIQFNRRLGGTHVTGPEQKLLTRLEKSALDQPEKLKKPCLFHWKNKLLTLAEGWGTYCKGQFT